MVASVLQGVRGAISPQHTDNFTFTCTEEQRINFKVPGWKSAMFSVVTHHVVRGESDVSEEHIASIFRV
jgi:hypothetical protein